MIPACFLLLSTAGCGSGLYDPIDPTEVSSNVVAATDVQAATINWAATYQTIDGFGGSDVYYTHSSMSQANQDFFFGTGPGQLGLSILRVGIPSGGPDLPGDCTIAGPECAGGYLSDMHAVVANGGKVLATPWSPPAKYKSNSSTICNSGAGKGALLRANYSNYATWLTNFILSLRAQSPSIPVAAISVQNEPDGCPGYDGALWTAAQISDFVGTALGPKLAELGLPTQILAPESSFYSLTTGPYGGGACATDAACARYVGGYAFHDYDANLTGLQTVAAAPYPSGWARGKRFWETEVSCGVSGTPINFCTPGFNTDITSALKWAAVIDQRLVNDQLNAWLYWWLVDENSVDDEGLMAQNGTIAKRAYILGQYARFVRPGYVRVGATHTPQQGVTISAYRKTTSTAISIVATNYTDAPITQKFHLESAPAFLTLVPTQTSASNSLAQLKSVAVSQNAFTYTLPAQSITTFTGSGVQ